MKTTCSSRQVKPIINASWAHFEHHAELDFSAAQPGPRFLLKLEIVTSAQNLPGQRSVKIDQFKSLAFQIKNNPYSDLVPQLLEFMRQQRCGFNPWLNTECHQADGRTVYGPLTNGTPWLTKLVRSRVTRRN